MNSKLLILILAIAGAACSQNRDFDRTSPSAPSNQAVVLPVDSAPKPRDAPKKANTAIVINPHANLRDADNASATVLRVVPQDASVEVVKQQGAWYLVKTETEQGWMHGNTLRLQSFDIEPPRPPEQPSKTSEPPAATVDLRIKGNENSMIYHLPGCASYDKISERNIVWFRTKEEAEQAGYRMARNC